MEDNIKNQGQEHSLHCPQPLNQLSHHIRQASWSAKIYLWKFKLTIPNHLLVLHIASNSVQDNLFLPYSSCRQRLGQSYCVTLPQISLLQDHSYQFPEQVEVCSPEVQLVLLLSFFSLTILNVIISQLQLPNLSSTQNPFLITQE